VGGKLQSGRVEVPAEKKVRKEKRPERGKVKVCRADINGKTANKGGKMSIPLGTGSVEGAVGERGVRGEGWCLPA